MAKIDYSRLPASAQRAIAEFGFNLAWYVHMAWYSPSTGAVAQYQAGRLPDDFFGKDFPHDAVLVTKGLE